MLAGIADFTGKIARTETPLSHRERGWGVRECDEAQGQPDATLTTHCSPS